MNAQLIPGELHLVRAVTLINLLLSFPCLPALFLFFHPSLLLSPFQTMIQLAAGCGGTSCLQMSDASVCAAHLHIKYIQA